MEIKLDSKLLLAINGMFLLAIGIMLMTVGDLHLHWLFGLFMMFSSCAICGAWFLDGKKDFSLVVKAGFYFLFAIVFFAKMEALILGYYFFILWAMIEAGLSALESRKLFEEKANLWFIIPGLAALAILMAFIACFVTNEILLGLAFLFVALAQVFPAILPFLPKVEIKK